MRPVDLIMLERWRRKSWLKLSATRWRGSSSQVKLRCLGGALELWNFLGAVGVRVVRTSLSIVFVAYTIKHHGCLIYGLKSERDCRMQADQLCE